MDTTRPITLLGNISIDNFLRDYWQKKPLVIRQSIPDFESFLNPNDLAGLSCEHDIQSRLVLHKRDQWLLEHGPFDEGRFATLPESNWTLLVQSVDQHLPEGKALLRHFNFIPYARLDDLMVSYAPKGGSVGPHFDSYDVFLLQGQGTRTWHISSQQHYDLVENCELRILQNFNAESSWELSAGDLLYLPPQYAHWGISSSDDCMTYSIGFRAPDYQSLGQAFLAFMQDQMAQEAITLAGRYGDPALVSTRQPAKIQPEMLKNVSTHLQKISMGNNEIGHFLGLHLTEPNPEVVFEQPVRLSNENFKHRIFEEGIILDLQSQCLYDDVAIYINGEREILTDSTRHFLQTFANQQALSSADVAELEKSWNEAVNAVLYRWYSAGYCHLETAYDAD